jgi:RNA 3'-terminal phosphate cyclase
MIVSDTNRFTFSHAPGTSVDVPYVITINGRSGSVTLTLQDIIDALGFSPSDVNISVGTSAPSSPAVNDLWIDTN